MLIFLWHWGPSVTGFLPVSVHLYFHDHQHVKSYPSVFISGTSASPISSPSLSLACLFLFIWVCRLSFPPLSFPDIAPFSLLFNLPPPVLSPLLSVSSSKWVFGCQCQSVGGGDESVALTVSLAMTVSADCHISVGGTFSTLCAIDLSSHHDMSQ